MSSECQLIVSPGSLMFLKQILAWHKVQVLIVLRRLNFHGKTTWADDNAMIETLSRNFSGCHLISRLFRIQQLSGSTHVDIWCFKQLLAQEGSSGDFMDRKTKFSSKMIRLFPKKETICGPNCVALHFLVHSQRTFYLLHMFFLCAWPLTCQIAVFKLWHCMGPAHSRISVFFL